MPSRDDAMALATACFDGDELETDLDDPEGGNP